MKERPILFSGEMVRAILEDRKTQTRRVVNQEQLLRKQMAAGIITHDSDWSPLTPLCPYGQAGDRLWVREAYVPRFFLDEMDGLAPAYKASWKQVTRNTNLMEPKWCPSIFMPRWASRITLEITGIRVQRVQKVGGADALAEGVWRPGPDADPDEVDRTYDAVGEYRHLWDSINTKRGYCWDANPMVWVIEFKVV